MHWRILPALLIFALVFSSCTCGGDSDDDSDGEDIVNDDAGDDTIDDTADDTADDTLDDDTADDSSDDTSDDEDPAYSCLWNADLPPDNSYEWVTEKVWDLEYGVGDSPGILFDENEPHIYWMEVQDGKGELYVAHKINGQWERLWLNESSQSIGSVDMELSPDGTIGVAIDGLTAWTPNHLSYCLLEDDEIRDCEGITDNIRASVKLAFQYDGRPGILVKEAGDAYLVYHERDASGVWQFSYLPTVTEYQPRSFAIGPDGEAHSANTYVICDPFDYTDCVNLSMHLHGTAGTTFGIDFLSADERIHSVSDMAVSPGNDIIAAVYQYDESPTQIAHRISRFKWDLIQLSSDQTRTTSFRVGYDQNGNAMVAYSLRKTPTSRTCWARWEGGLWRKEIVDIESEFDIHYDDVYDIKVDDNGNIGILYKQITMVGYTGNYSLKFAHRVPKYTLHPSEADK